MLTTGRRRALAAIAATIRMNTLEAAVSAAINGSGMPKPGTSLSISSNAPIANATIPPSPSAP